MENNNTFALFFGNRGFFPESLIAYAREEMQEAVKEAGYKCLMMDANSTAYGAVESREEGRLYAKWLAAHRGEYDGVILCLPNFGDENGAVEALIDCGVPILLQAYPDEIGKMDFAHRRDAYCGKFSIADVFHQCRLPFTMLQPHVVHPKSGVFKQNLADFAAICRVVRGMRRFTVGAIGARTTAFKTVRYDEIALQKYGITVEAFDLSGLFAKVRKYGDEQAEVVRKLDTLKSYTNCGMVPPEKLIVIAKVGVVLDEYVEEFKLDCITLRCWEEMQEELGVAPCLLLGELNDRGIAASCEIDLCSAINMYSMELASGKAATVLDWNNNYTDDLNKVILFHCGPVPQSLMTGKGTLTHHKILGKARPGRAWGSNEGRISPFPFTYSNCKTEDGKLTFYADHGVFTDDPIESEFFGCGGVALIEDLQPKLVKLGQNGFKHHTAVGVGHMKDVLREAFTRYLNYDMLEL
jgi:L-fucose isomerase-like protein